MKTSLKFLLFLSCTLWSGAQTAPKLLPFQGRLTDQNGVAVPDGARLIQFRIYDVPTGGNAVWPGEIHRTTVNGGLVNVVLGTKTSLNTDIFNRILYLDIVVDANGDNQITAADPPLLPRQAILPVVFAQESGNAGKLAGRDWSDLLDSGDPRTGKLSGDRIKPGSVGTDQINDGAVTESKLGTGAVSGRALGNGSVGLANLNTSVAMQLGKTFTGKPESIVRMNNVGDSYTIPAGKWALVKANLSCHYAIGAQGLTEVLSYDAYALSGQKVSIIGFLGPGAIWSRIMIDDFMVAQVILAPPKDLFSQSSFNADKFASVSIYLYPDQ